MNIATFSIGLVASFKLLNHCLHDGHVKNQSAHLTIDFFPNSLLGKLKYFGWCGSEEIIGYFFIMIASATSFDNAMVTHVDSVTLYCGFVFLYNMIT